MKTCNTCNKEKDDDEFPQHRRKCKECQKAYLRDYYYRNKKKKVKTTDASAQTGPDMKSLTQTIDQINSSLGKLIIDMGDVKVRLGNIEKQLSEAAALTAEEDISQYDRKTWF